MARVIVCLVAWVVATSLMRAILAGAPTRSWLAVIDEPKGFGHMIEAGHGERLLVLPRGFTWRYVPEPEC
jgi:hypothetical protein